jgi:YVTN family beta-propeller protein
MKKIKVYFVITTLALLNTFGTVGEQGPVISLPNSLATDIKGKILFVSDKESEQILVYDIASGAVVRKMKIPFSPANIELLDESQMLVVGGGEEGTLVMVDIISGKILSSIETGHTPRDITILQSSAKTYVCNQFSNDVTVINLKRQKEIKRIPVLREPISMSATPDEQFLFVLNQLPADPSVQMIVSAEISIISTREDKVIKNIKLPNGSTGLKDICISPDGKYAYVTPNHSLPT